MFYTFDSLFKISLNKINRKMCQTTLLSRQGETHISICSNCKTIHIWQKSYLLVLNETQFENFIEATQKNQYQEGYSRTADGEMRMIIHTPCPEIFFTFNEEEWLDFKTALHESFYMRQIYMMLQ